MPLFDAHVMVDWSAASTPNRGKDSIWLGIARPGAETSVENIPTRHTAVARLRDIAREIVARGQRVLIGFDFPFGYPAGVAERVTGHASALSLWHWIAGRIEDDESNANNRFDIAAEINRLYSGIGPFWGRPAGWDHPDVPTRQKERHGHDHPPERRLVDIAATGAKTVWQLAYAGSVGSQVLTGIPAVLRLREDPDLAEHCAIWPFETGLAAPDTAVVLAEIYPSLIRPDATEAIKDAGQVRAVADHLAGLDRDDALAPLFAGPQDASPAERARIMREEAWILNLGAPTLRAVEPVRPPAGPPGPTSAPPPLRYVRDPAEIYRESFRTVREEAPLAHLPECLHEVAIRLVHACGMPDITNRLAWSADLVRSARTALGGGAPVLCDCEAVASMIVRARLPKANRVICTLNAPEVPALARRIGNTRSAAAVRLWEEHIAGAVVAIGNAPTALFHLLELLDRGWSRPAAILGFPVGFVGAAESKSELARDPRGAAYLTLRGRRGGSAMAAAAVNALAAGLETPT